MGQSSSSSTCRDISDKDVLYYTKQFFTINKVIDILGRIEQGELVSLDPPQNYMLDLSVLVPDLYYNEPNDLTVLIYKPTNKVAGIEGGRVVEQSTTVLHDYNEFVLKESKILGDGLVERATQIGNEMTEVSNELLKYISASCSDVGVFVQE